MPDITARPNIETLTPMPAFAPVVSPPELRSVVEGEVRVSPVGEGVRVAVRVLSPRSPTC
jgi:hypothetical protein